MASGRASAWRGSAMTANMDEAGAMHAIRRYRCREAVRLIWRDVNGLDTVEETVAGSSALAESCLSSAYEFAERTLSKRHGVPRNETGERQRLVILGLGKLGGGELNFSSDIDLILAFPENGASDGTPSIANEAWFARCGQLITKLLGEISVDGYAFRVDLRDRKSVV